MYIALETQYTLPFIVFCLALLGVNSYLLIDMPCLIEVRIVCKTIESTVEKNNKHTNIGYVESYYNDRNIFIAVMSLQFVFLDM